MNYLLIKVGVNKGLILIKSIFKTIMISYYNGKVGVCLHVGIRFVSCFMHVINILIFSFIYYTYFKLDIGFLHISRSV